MRRFKWVIIGALVLFIVVAPTDADHVILTLISGVQDIVLAIIHMIKAITSEFNLH